MSHLKFSIRRLAALIPGKTRHNNIFFFAPKKFGEKVALIICLVVVSHFPHHPREKWRAKERELHAWATFLKTGRFSLFSAFIGAFAKLTSSNPCMAYIPRPEPGPHWWRTSALTNASPLPPEPSSDINQESSSWGKIPCTISKSKPVTHLILLYLKHRNLY